MGITTRRGDGGCTGLLYGPRVRKDHARIRALGALDELNAWLGLVKARHPRPAVRATLHDCQEALMTLMSEVATPPQARGRLKRRLDAATVRRIEAHTACATGRAGDRGRIFALPGANELSALLDVARSVARRAERDVVACEKTEMTAPVGCCLNRLSDLLFLLAREAEKMPSPRARR